MGIDVFTPRLGHGGNEFTIGQTNERNGKTADSECQQSAERPCSRHPQSRHQHPTPADHRTKGQSQGVSILQDFDESIAILSLLLGYGGYLIVLVAGPAYGNRFMELS